MTRNLTALLTQMLALVVHTATAYRLSLKLAGKV